MRRALMHPVLLLGSLLLVALLLFGGQAEAREVNGLSRGAQRSVLQKISEEEEKALKEEEEFEREQAALREFSQAQAEQESEKQRLLDAGSDLAVELVKDFWKLKGKKRTDLFTNLWKSGDGLVIRLMLSILAESDDLEEANPVVVEAMEIAEEEGFNIKIAEAVSNAITVVAEDGDADPFVDVLVIRMNSLNKESEGSGCDFINFLFADVESFAISENREFDVILAIDDEKYSELVSCYYDECRGEAAECCFDDKALQQGSCQCGKGKQSRVCGFNLYHKQPRTIWVCNTDQCFEGQKCLCPAERPPKGQKPKKNNKNKPQSAGGDKFAKKKGQKKKNAKRNKKGKQT